MSEKQVFHLVLKALLVAALVAVLLYAAFHLIDLLVLVFGAIVVAVLIRALAEAIARRTPLSGTWALTAALLLIVAVFAGLGMLFGAQVRSQFSQLLDTLPSALEVVREKLLLLPGGEALVASLGSGSWLEGNVLPRIPGIVFSATSAITGLLLVIFAAIYIAADPRLYRRGLLLLVPMSRRQVVDEALGASGEALRKWMVGQLVSMVLIGTLTGLGLWAVGVPSALALGLIAGFLEVIPWAGPILASVPILILALAQGPQTALLALAVVVVIQQLEGVLVTPFVQEKAVSLPPALTIFGVVAGGILFGAVGLLFAAPLLVVVYVLVQRLYVEEALHTPLERPGEGKGRL